MRRFFFLFPLCFLTSVFSPARADGTEAITVPPPEVLADCLAGNANLPAGVSGDVNHDGGVDAVDLVSLLVEDASSRGWAKTWGDDFDDAAQNIATDGAGNAYLVGFFKGTVDFDPGPGSDSHASKGGRDAFLAKFDRFGNFVWARTWGGSDDDSGNGVAVDPNGYVYVSGRYRNTVDFKPGSGTDNHVSNNPNGGNNAFLCKYDTKGNFKWARTWGGAGGGGTMGDEAYGVVLDQWGNVYVSGDFSSPTLDFDPGGGTDSHANNGFFDAFMTKFDPNGNFLLARTWGGSGYDDATRLFVDPLDVVYVEGICQGTVDFDPGSGVDSHSVGGTAADYGTFLSQFDSDGNFQWARTWGGSGWDLGELVTSDGPNVYVAGYFEGSDDFDPGPGSDVHAAHGSRDAFLSKFDAHGNHVWTKTWGGSGEDKCTFMLLGGDGSLYVSGWFNDTVDFDPGSGSETRSSEGGNDAYFSKFDGDGHFLWVNAWGGTGNDAALSLALDGDGNILVSGWFSDAVDFDPGGGSDDHTSRGAMDAFVAKYLPDSGW